jgi:SHAQKYF class myb-like DNA-binding protein
MQQISKKQDSLMSEKAKFKNSNKKFSTECVISDTKKKYKVKKAERLIFGLIKDDSASEVTGQVNISNKESSLEKRHFGRRKKKDSTFNTGRWHSEEHQRFIEALLKFGNDWKNVQKFVGSRSSTQARSHAQKFFVKIGKTQIENLHLDFENNSLKSLNIMASKLNSEQLSRAIKSLNELAFDRKNSGRKNLKSEKNYKSLKFEQCEYEKSEKNNNFYEKVQNFSNFYPADNFNFYSDEKMNCYSTSGENSPSFTLIKK